MIEYKSVDDVPRRIARRWRRPWCWLFGHADPFMLRRSLYCLRCGRRLPVRATAGTPGKET